MTVSVKKGILWRREIENEPGAFAKTLEPFSEENVNLEVVVGYSSPRPGGKGTVELFPVAGVNGEKAAAKAGLSAMREVPCLIIDGDDRPGLAYKIAKVIADTGINLHFAMCQSIGNKFHGCLGFSSDADADKAENLIASADFT